MPKLSELLEGIDGIELKGPDVEIKGVAYDSRRVKAGGLFICLQGEEADGHDFAGEAAKRGAVAVLAARSLELPGLSLALCPDPLASMSVIAEEYYGHPARKLMLYAITGTNGKTTTSYLLRSMFEASGVKTGLVGTVGYSWGDRSLAATVTTPLSLDLQEIFAGMVADGVQAIAMEVSSHALSLNRVNPRAFKAAAFTNFTQDHLDFHGDMGSYLESKLSLFRGLSPQAVAVYNREDESCRRVANEAACRTLGYGADEEAECRLLRGESDSNGIRIALVFADGEEVQMESSLLGDFNIYNLLCAAALAHAAALPTDAMREGAAALAGVPGRMEKVERGQDFTVIVDYAHSPDALEHLLAACRRLTAARLLVVFGCGGGRDKGKRPRMGAAACRLADVVVVTSDNPRREDPAVVIEDILAGCEREKVTVEADRRKAIAIVFGKAREGDLVAIAGKGHEDYQLIGEKRLSFDDRVVAGEVLEELKKGGSKEAR